MNVTEAKVSGWGWRSPAGSRDSSEVTSLSPAPPALAAASRLLSQAQSPSQPQTSSLPSSAKPFALDRAVLVVEDDPSSRNALRLILTHDGWRVSVAATLSEALNYLSDAPQCVILDLMLPDGDGAEVLRFINQHQLASRVIVISGVADPERIAQVKSLRPAFFLIKPINIVELLQKMQ